MYRWTRDLHLYLGLFVSPFVVTYALSAIFFVHAWRPWGGPQGADVERRTVPVVVVDDANGLIVAQQVRAQVGIAGEIGFISRNEEARRITFPIESAGRRTLVRVDLAAGQAVVASRATGLPDGLIHLHRMPGPHNTSIRGNWLYTRLWGWLADTAVYALLFLSASGIYMWTVLKAERKTGLIILGGGALSFVTLLVVTVA